MADEYEDDDRSLMPCLSPGAGHLVGPLAALQRYVLPTDLSPPRTVDNSADFCARAVRERYDWFRRCSPSQIQWYAEHGRI